ncbi:MAG: class I mannose-6-phosphate isomerase [Leptospira sp.]|nr:class I mannose-6-phosphate isomerase [Leptospira sp.]
MPAVLRFNPIYKEKIWGGRKLEKVLGRTIPPGEIGESWDVSDYLDDKSVILDGPWKGREFRSVFKMYPREVLGSGFEGLPFPLLVKIIDAKEKLSVQVHPSDEYASKKDPKNSGKKEAWIVMDADKDAQLVVGFSKKLDRETYAKLIEKNQAESVLQSIPVKPGDAFLLEPGTVHAIGAGVLLLEIQQSSDSTYRVYDYGRPRELHLEKALDVLNFKKSTGKEWMEYKPSDFIGAGKLFCLTENNKFRIYILDMKPCDDFDPEDFEPEDYILPTVTKRPRFHIYTILEGGLRLTSGEEFKKGESFLLTASGSEKEILFTQVGKTPTKLVISTVGSDYD